jgi:uncharacterized membrane protein YqjE
LLLAAAIVLWVDPVQRWLAAGLLGLLFLGGGVVAALNARAQVTLKPRPFDATLSELRKDHELLKD